MTHRRILIVDDEALFRTSAADSLRARFKNVEVLEAEDGQVAIETLESCEVDVVVTDLQMPRVGGLELVTYIANHRLPAQVIVVSAHINESSRNTLDELGALACIDKPIELDALRQKVERMLSVPRAHVKGVALSGFLQLLEMERQTCGVRVSSSDGTGLLVFEQGQLMDARTGDLRGNEAAMALLRFHNCTLDIVTILQPTNPTTTLPLSFLMLEAARQADEELERESGAPKWPAEGDADELELFAASLRPPPLVTEPQESPLVRAAMALGGARAAALVDISESAVRASQSMLEELDVEEVALENAKLYVTERNLLQRLGVQQQVEEVLIANTGDFHILRPFASAGEQSLLFLIVDRASTNLALTRKHLEGLEEFFSVQRAQQATGSA